MGFVLLGGLTLLSALAGTAIAARMYPESRADRALAAFVWWLALTLAPIHVLAWTQRLYPLWLALASAVLSIVILVALHASRSPKERLVQTGRAIVELVRLPVDALVEAWRDRSFVIVGLIGVYIILLWMITATWLVPSGSWDGLTYHEPIVYYTIQNHGRIIVDVPSDVSIQQVNTAPRFGHYLSLWFVIFTDRRLVELPSTLLTLGLLLAGYRLFRMHTSRVDAMGYACALLLFPAVALQMRSTYQDGSFACVFAMAVYYVARPGGRQRDAWMAAITLGMAGEFKFTALMLVPVCGAVVLVRTAIAAYQQKRWTWLPVWIGGLAIVAACMAPTYVRNWRTFHNPVWPRDMDIKSLGVHFEGPYDAYNVHNSKPAKEVLELVTAPPKPGTQFADTRDNGYGNGPPFVVLPLALIAIVALWVRLLAGVTKLGRRPTEQTRSLAWLAFASFLPLPLSPSFHWARYTVYALPALLALVVWLVGRPKWQGFSRAVMGTLLAMGFVTLWWSEPGWAAPMKELPSWLKMSAAERATLRVEGNFNMVPAMAERRDAELGAGDVLAYTQDVFIGSFWNERISNRVVYVAAKRGEKFMNRLRELDAKWAVVAAKSAAEKALAADGDHWVRYGVPFIKGRQLVIYARGKSPDPKPEKPEPPKLKPAASASVGKPIGSAPSILSAPPRSSR